MDGLPLPMPRPFVDAISPVMFGPNITGGITGFDYEKGSGKWVYGAFVTDSTHFGTSAAENYCIAKVSFQAQRASSIYGSDLTVQPASLRGLACIKF